MKKVLIIGNRLLGDAIDSLHSVLSLENSLKNSLSSSNDEVEYYFIGYRYSAFIYQEKISFRSCYYLDGQPKFGGFNFLKNVVRGIRYIGKFDIIFILPGGFGWGLLAFLLRGKIRVGHRGDFRSIFLTHSVTLQPNQENYRQFDQLFLILASAKVVRLEDQVHGDASCFPLEPIESPKFSLDTELKGWVVFSIMASESYKIWPQRYFVELAKKIKAKYGCQIVFVGTPKEATAIAKVSEEVGGVNLAGKSSIGQVFTLIKKSLFFVGNDSGLTHAAAMVGAVNFTIVGPTNPTLSFPHNPKGRTHFIYREVDIPHSERRSKKLDKKIRREIAMESITVEEVWQKIEKVIK